jgi:hypothetical protein
LVYCASTFNWGGGAASGGAPLPSVMEISPGTFSSERKPVLRLNSLVRGENAVVGASGYHSHASFHKDDNRARPAKAQPPGTGRRGGYEIAGAPTPECLP